MQCPTLDSPSQFFGPCDRKTRGEVRAGCELIRQASEQYEAYNKAREQLGERRSLYDSYVYLYAAVQLLTQAKITFSRCKPTDLDRCQLTRIDDVIEDLTGKLNDLNAQLSPLAEQLSQAALGENGQLSQQDQEAVALATRAAFRFDKDKGGCTFWFDNIIGQQQAKERLKDTFIRPLLYPNLFPAGGKGILLYGAPGTGKSVLAKSCVNELQAEGGGCVHVLFFAPQTGQMKGKYVGETEKQIEGLYRGAHLLAVQNAKATGKRTISIIFLDEIDGIAPPGRGGEGAMSQIAASSVNALLQVIDGFRTSPYVVTLAATNFPWGVDEAVVRRFAYKVQVTMPSAAELEQKISLDLSQYLARTFSKINTVDRSQFDEQIEQTTKKDTPAPSNCRKEVVNFYRWRAQGEPWTPYVTQKLSVEGIHTVAKLMEDKHYSPSDAERLVQDVLRQAGSEAAQDGRFVRLTASTPFVLPAACFPVGSQFPPQSIQFSPIMEESAEFLASVLFGSGPEYVSNARSDINLPLTDNRLSAIYLHSLGNGVYDLLLEVRLPVRQLAEGEITLGSREWVASAPVQYITNHLVNRQTDAPWSEKELANAVASGDLRGLIEDVQGIEDPAQKAELLRYLRAAPFPGAAGTVRFFFEARSFLKTADKKSLLGWFSGWRTETVTSKERAATIFDTIVAAGKYDRVYAGSGLDYVELSPREVPAARIVKLLQGSKIRSLPASINLLSAFAATYLLDTKQIGNSVAAVLGVERGTDSESVDCMGMMRLNSQMVNWNLSTEQFKLAATRVTSTVSPDTLKQLKEYESSGKRPQ